MLDDIFGFAFLCFILGCFVMVGVIVLNYDKDKDIYNDLYESSKTVPIGEYIWIHEKIDKIKYLGKDMSAYYIKYKGDRLTFTLTTRKIVLGGQALYILDANEDGLVVAVEPLIEENL